jgi:dihydrofolate synthase / folylpolyglutamate synthase
MHVNPTISAMLEGLSNPSLPGIELSLERMVALLAALGDPHKKIAPVIHFAGTNGKGSTLAFMRAMYEAAGYRVHAYTSPHLVHFNERIVIAGADITDTQLLPLLERVGIAASKNPATFFEATTALAFLAFSEYPADVVLLETGLGGRLDATNVIDQPIMTVITPIDYDHMEFLGSTLEAIAAEKAGILKSGVPCVVGAQMPEVLPVLARAAYAARSPLMICGKSWNAAVTSHGIRVLMDTVTLELPFPALLGAHQLHNAAVAAVAAKECAALPISDEHIAQGVSQARWPARLQHLKQGPLVDAWGARGAVILDGAHNEHAAKALVEWLVHASQPITLVLGMMRRKDASVFTRILAPFCNRLIAVPIAGEACYAPEELVNIAKNNGFQYATSCDDMADLSQMLHVEEKGTLLIAGSLFLAGEVLKNHG